MKVDLIPIGNSKGVRIPRSIIKQCDFGNQIDMRVDQGSLVLTSAPNIRTDWDSAFSKMGTNMDDTLLIPDTLPNEWDEEEWDW